MIELLSSGWSSGPVALTTGFWQRFRGIKGVPPEVGVLLRTRSVHTFGLCRSLRIVALSPSCEVLTTDTVEPRRVVWVAGASQYLELPEGRTFPSVGDQLEVRPIVTS